MGASVGARRPDDGLRRAGDRTSSVSTAARCCCASPTTTPARRRPSRRAPRAVSECARRGLPIMVEPLPYHLDVARRGEAARRRRRVAAGRGRRRRPRQHELVDIWLKVPAAKDPARMLASTTLPGADPRRFPGPGSGGDLRVVGGGDGGAQRAWPRRRAGVAVSRRTAMSPRPSTAAARIVRPGSAVMTLHRPHGSLADGADPVALDARRRGVVVHGAAGAFVGPGSRALHRDRRVRRPVVLPLSATDVTVRCDGEHVQARRPVVGVRQGHRLRLRAPRTRP